MRIHFIAIGGSAMHNLAIALHQKAYNISGSDDEIFEPSKSRLQKHGLLPTKIGWNQNNINNDIEAVILGMHAKEDNPELIKAKELGIRIFSYPEYLYEQSKNKKRIVIGGSHGKTTITAIILHVLNYWEIDCDFMIGAKLDGFEVMVKITENAEYMLFEGDEYLTSAIDKRPKFHLYKPHIALLSGIAWDHMNVFPTFDNYCQQFEIFVQLIEENGVLIYCDDDSEVSKVAESANSNISKYPYSIPEYKIENGITSIINDGIISPLEIFGKHNLLNLNGAKLVCHQLGITSEKFFEAASSFKGASNRLELIGSNNHTAIFKDFAHSPSKLNASSKAVKEQFENRKLVACMELHTYSSLNKTFLEQYIGTMDSIDEPIVYYNSHSIQLKKLSPLNIEDVQTAFNNKNIKVFNDSELLINHLKTLNWENKNLLMMSSGNFDNLDFKDLCNEILC